MKKYYIDRDKNKSYKLQKGIGRYKGEQYSKYTITIPNDIVNQVGEDTRFTVSVVEGCVVLSPVVLRETGR